MKTPTPSQRKHTALPWKVSVCADERHHSHSIMSVELSRKMEASEPAAHPLLAAVRFGRGHVDAREAEANAQFIVTACNAHYDLLAACEAVVDLPSLHLPTHSKLLNKVRSALRKAKGGVE